MALRKSILVRYALALSLLGALLFLPSSRAQQEPYLGLIQVISHDPNAGGGTPGVANELLVRTDAPEIYFYQGTPTSWLRVGGIFGPGTVTSVACGSGLTCAPASPITGAGTISANLTGTGTSTDLTAWTGANTIGNYGGSSPSACTTGQAVTGEALSAAGALTHTCTTLISGTNTDLVAFTGANTIGNYAGSTPSACSAGQAVTQPALSAAGALTTTCAAFVPAASVSGTTNTIPKFTSASAIGNSSLSDNGTKITAGEPFVTVTVNTDGQAALFSTYSNALGAVGNLWIGGGGQSFSGAGAGGTGDNTALGIQALNSCTTCFGNVAIGFQALETNVNGITTTAIGYGALNVATNSVDNTVIGYLAGSHLTTGNTNTSVGVESLSTCTTCTDNAVYGMSSGQQLTTGFSNTCVGPSTGCSTSGSYNLAAGYGAGASYTTGVANVAIGVNTMNTGAGVSGSANTAVGDAALIAVTSGGSNTAIGDLTLQSLTTQSDDTAVGDGALRFATAGNCTAVGALALGGASMSGLGNVAVGYSMGSSVTSGQGNVFLGYNSPSGITTGGLNIVIGDNMNAIGITSGNYNTVIGSAVSGLGNISNSIVLADGQGALRFQTKTQTIDARNAPTSVSHGTITTGSSNYAGSVTSVGANTSTTLTYSAAFTNRSFCTATVLSSGAGIGEIIIITPSASAPVFSCFDSTTAVAANCPDFSYICVGQ